MVSTLKLPVGIDSFEKIRRNNFYYIDKTKLIEQLVETGGEVTLFTRPRRFGKTLNMSMLKSFFEVGTDESLFDGLYISGSKELCDKYMGKYPVIFLSLKSAEGRSFDDARYMITELIGREAEKFKFLEHSEALSENDKDRYRAIISLCDGKYTMDEQLLVSSLQSLSQLLFIHYGQKAVILIDEYDVPLDKAFQNGYYKEMVSLIRGLFGKALKTNEFLQFAVLTGCLRVSKESIITGLNNFEINSIVDIAHDEQFGFTDDEVRLPDSESYAYKLVIPNKEVREVFVLQIQEWFKAVVAKDDDTMKLLSRAILDKDEKQIARQLNIVMSRMISILDTKASDDMKENFYHGLLLGLLRGSNPGWLIKSNRESGDGFSDILIKPEDPDAGIVIEVKYAKEMKNLDVACEAAMTQIKEKRYDEALRDEGRCDILAYGIAFCRKRCRVVGEKIND